MRRSSNWGCYYFLFKKKAVNVLSDVTHSPSHHQAGAPLINIQSKLRTVPDLCKNVPRCYLVAAVILIYSLYTVRCVYPYTYSAKYTDAGRAKK